MAALFNALQGFVDALVPEVNALLKRVPPPLLKACLVASALSVGAAVHIPALAMWYTGRGEALPCAVLFAVGVWVNECVFRKDWRLWDDAGGEYLTFLMAGPVALVWTGALAVAGGFMHGEKPGDIMISDTLGYTCAGVMGACLLVLWYSVWLLGKRFTRVLTVHDDHTLCKEGPYAWVRHPGYGAVLCILPITGVVIGANVLLTLAMFPTAYVVLFKRVQAEEEMLVKSFGDAYLEYKTATGDVLPGVDVFALPAAHYAAKQK